MATKIPIIEVEFKKDGGIFNPQQVEEALKAAPKFTDLFVISHGWNNDIAEARLLYSNLFTSLEKLLDGNHVQGLGNRSFAALGVFWPSKRFADKDLIPGGGAASATAANDQTLQSLLEELKRDPERLGQPGSNSVRSLNLSRAQALVPQLEQSAEARREFVFQLRSILDPSEAHEEDGSEEFFTKDPLQLFNDLAQPVNAPLAPAADTGGATAMGESMDGGAAGLRDLLDGITAAARRLANFTTYYEMKQRAGLVGRVGLSQVLRQIRRQNSGLKLHLIGHSFGGRLVTAAADALDANTPAVTLALLQAAYSHNGLAQGFDEAKKRDGFFRKVISEKRISGPILITHTKNDRAVGIAYPLASRIANEVAAALGDENDPYGGMGRNGAQHTPEAETPGELLNVGKNYSFETGKVFNLRADRFISNHSDVTGFEVGYALLNGVKCI